MEKEKAEDLRELLEHPDETAGGLMTTGFLQIAPHVTVESAIVQLKAVAADLDIIDYLYVVNEEEVLLGVVSIRDLLTAHPRQPLSDIQSGRLVAVQVNEDQKDVVVTFAKYGFRALPVLDEDGHLKGVISFRSVLEVLVPDEG